MFKSLTLLAIFNLQYQYRIALISCRKMIITFLLDLLAAINNATVINKYTSKI